MLNQTPLGNCSCVTLITYIHVGIGNCSCVTLITYMHVRLVMTVVYGDLDPSASVRMTVVRVRLKVVMVRIPEIYLLL